MNRNIILLLSIFLLAILLPAIALYVPTSLPAGSDFSALYNTDLALIHRVPIYDLEKVDALAQPYSGVPANKFFLARFPYPPWYALSTFYLGLMPAQAAATLWFELNLVMLFLSVWFLTDGWSGRMRLIAFPLALFFMPVLGALSVGQYDFPVLLGTSLLIYSLRRENIALTVVGVILLTFKPHVGALILLAALGWLLVNWSSFGRGIMRPLLMTAAILILSGFVADPQWIISYPRMLLGYQSEGNVSACSECASLPVWMSRWLFDGLLTKAIGITIALFFVFLLLFYLIRSFLNSHQFLLSFAILVTLLISPYLYNYDFLLLLVPFAVLFRQSRPIEKFIVLLCYLVPTFILILYRREGNISLLVASFVLLFLLLGHARGPIIDFKRPGAYNTQN